MFQGPASTFLFPISSLSLPLSSLLFHASFYFLTDLLHHHHRSSPSSSASASFTRSIRDRKNKLNASRTSSLCLPTFDRPQFAMKSLRRIIAVSFFLAIVRREETRKLARSGRERGTRKRREERTRNGHVAGTRHSVLPLWKASRTINHGRVLRFCRASRPTCVPRTPLFRV